MENLCDKKEFESLFEELTGGKFESALQSPDGWVFIPPEANLSSKDPDKRARIGGHGWRNRLVADQYAGWWVKAPPAE